MLAIERLDALTAMLHHDGRVVVREVAARLGITQETVRRDLDRLEESGVARRVHGGAVLASASSLAEPTTDERVDLRTEAKRSIGVLAARRLVALGATSVLVDAGTTTWAFAHALRTTWPEHGAARLVVVTHAPTIAALLLDHPAIEVHLLGGRLRPVTGAAVGAQTVLAIQALRPDVVVLGTNAIDDGGCSTPDPEEAAVKQAMVAAGRRVACLADASKHGASSLQRFAPLERIDVLITDAPPQGRLATALEAASCEVHVA